MITKFKLFENKKYSFEYRGIEDVKRYINNGGDVNEIFCCNKTILQEILAYSIDGENQELGENQEVHMMEDIQSIKLLLKNGFTNLDNKNSYNGRTALITATEIENMEENADLWLVKILIDAGAKWDIVDDSGYDFLDNLYEEDIIQLKKLYPNNPYWEYYNIKNNLKKFNI